MFGLKREDYIILTLDRDENNIGRHTSNHIVINSLPVSRFHSSILRVDGRIFIKDKQTINGTFIGKHKILPNRETLLKAGDLIGIGCRANENKQCTFEVVKIEHELPKESADSASTQSLNHGRSTPDSSTDRKATFKCKLEPQDSIVVEDYSESQKNIAPTLQCSSNTASSSITILKPTQSSVICAKPSEKSEIPENSPEDTIVPSNTAGLNNELVQKLLEKEPEITVCAAKLESESSAIKTPMSETSNLIEPTVLPNSSRTGLLKTSAKPAQELNPVVGKRKSDAPKKTKTVKRKVDPSKTRTNKTIDAKDEAKIPETISVCKSVEVNYDVMKNEKNCIPTIINVRSQSADQTENVPEIIDLLDDDDNVIIIDPVPESVGVNECPLSRTGPVYGVDSSSSNSEVRSREIASKSSDQNHGPKVKETCMVDTILELEDESRVDSTTPESSVKTKNSKQKERSVNFSSELSKHDANLVFKIPAVPATRTVQPDHLQRVNLIQSDEKDIKPCLAPVVAAYSTSDEIVLLDSDEEDFPCSQLNTTQIDDVPDFSSAFESMYNNIIDISDDEDDEKPQVLYCNEVPWFKPIDGQYQVGKKLVVSLPIKLEPREETSIQCEQDDEIGMDESTIPPILGKISHEAIDGEAICIDNVDGHNVTAPLNRVPDLLSEEEDSVEEMKAQTSDRLIHLATQIKMKYQLKHCVVRLPILDENLKKKSLDTTENVDQKLIFKKVKHTKKLLEHEPSIVKKKRKREKESSKCKHKKVIQPAPIMSTKEQELLRKEKLRKLAESQKKARDLMTEANEKVTTQPVVIKDTNKNRSAFLIDSIVNDPGSNKTKKKTEKLPSVLSNAANSSVPQPIREADCETGLTPDLPPLENIHNNREEIYDSYLSEQLDTRIPNIPENRNTADLNVQDMDISEDEAEKIMKNEKSVKSASNDSYPIVEQGEIVTNRITAFNQSCDGTPRIVPIRKALTALDLGSNVMTDIDAKKKSRSKVANEKVDTKQKKSNLKVKFDKNIPIVKKKVFFCHQFNRCEKFESDPEERRNNGIFAPAYKLHERLIREELFEFETAVAVVCKWNVKWLEEQQKYSAPPELYKPNQNYPPEHRLMSEYKEQLKSEMYLNLWKAIFRSWDKPNQDFLPHTQYMAQGNKIGLCSLHIDYVDTSRPGLLWTIYASRIINPFDCGEDIINGQIVILSFHVKQRHDQVPRKTMVFAYVASVSDSPTSDGSKHQRIIFKIHQKDFEVMAGEVKIKTLTYTKTHLRPFQGLSMIARSPITDLFVDPRHRYSVEPYFKDDETFKDMFLDPSQKKAVITCLNNIISPQPSICVIDGAPGTGKSQVIVSLLHELFSKHRRNMFPDDLKVLVITSCDNIADDVSYRVEKLDKNDCNVTLLRYGNCRRVHHKIRYCTLDDKVKDLISKDDGTTLINLEEEKCILKGQTNSFKLVLNSPNAPEEKLVEAKNKLAAIEKIYSDMKNNDSKIIEQLKAQAAKTMAIENADVIVTSVQSCWSSCFENDFVPSQYNKGDIHKFTVCIFDDANYQNEIGMLIPIMLLVRCLILVGDSKNLAYLDRANSSPFLRLVADFRAKSPSSLVTLNTQHRMIPDLSDWVSGCFNLGFQKRYVRHSRFSLNPLLVASFLCDNVNLKESCWWESQAVFCVRLLQKIMEIERSEAATIGLIIVREEQRAAIKRHLYSSGLDRVGKIRVDTVEQFSGRENEIVILCLPVNFKQLDSWLYVACTRARSCLIVCGYLAAIEGSNVISQLISYAKLRNVYAACDPQTDDIPYTMLRLTARTL